MPAFRGKIFEHYLKRGLEKTAQIRESVDTETLTKIAGSIDRHRFRGAGIKLTAVVRCDLNGYSDWCRTNSEIDKRIRLLDDFFTRSVISVDNHGGVYFRDEGDCMVVLFSDYFGGTDSMKRVNAFCRSVSCETYGDDGLTAKSVVSVGDVVFYQKTHQTDPEEWSADGDAFIFASRMEAEADSSQVVHFRKEEYDQHFTGTVSQDPNWTTEEVSVVIAGLRVAAGRQMIVKDIFHPSGNDDDKPEKEDEKKSLVSLLATTQSPDPYEKRGGGRYA